MLTLKELMTRIAEEKKTVDKSVPSVPLHKELETLDGRKHFNPGYGSVSSTTFLGPKNTHFDKIHKMVIDRGYTPLPRQGEHEMEYQKDINGGKSTAKVKIAHAGKKHVYSVETITYLNHY